MRKITVVGAGISGPAAALAYQRLGYDVTVREARSKVESTSGGVLGITAQSMAMLTGFLGIRPGELMRYQESDVLTYTVVGGQVVNTVLSHYDGHYVTWQDLHDALTRRLSVSYGDKVTSRPDGPVIWADGIGSMGRRTFDPARKFHYAGYSVFRGIKPGNPGNNLWHSFVDRGDFVFNRGHTYYNNGSQTDWALFMPWPEGEFRRHIMNIGEGIRSVLFCKVARLLPAAEANIVMTTPVISASAIGDWDIPRRLYFGRDNMLIGDAVATMRPHTSMGANLGITEGVSLALRQHGLASWSRDMVGAVSAQIARGKVLGSHLMPAA